MAKKVIDKRIGEIKKALEGNKVVIGTAAVMKGLQENILSKIFLSVNTPEKVQKEIASIAEIGSIPMESVEETNVELGVICKKPFSISVLAIK